MKKLTDSGPIDEYSKVKDVDEVIDISVPEKKELPKQEIKPLPQQPIYPSETKKEMIKRWNDQPIPRQQGVRVMKKSTYIGLWSLAGFIILLMIIGMVWGITTFKNKDFTPKVTNDINVAPPNVTVPINNNYTHNIENKDNLTININVGDELSQIIADEVIDIINNKTNSS